MNYEDRFQGKLLFNLGSGHRSRTDAFASPPPPLQYLVSSSPFNARELYYVAWDKVV